MTPTVTVGQVYLSVPRRYTATITRVDDPSRFTYEFHDSQTHDTHTYAGRIIGGEPRFCISWMCGTWELQTPDPTTPAPITGPIPLAVGQIYCSPSNHLARIEMIHGDGRFNYSFSHVPTARGQFSGVVDESGHLEFHHFGVRDYFLVGRTQEEALARGYDFTPHTSPTGRTFPQGQGQLVAVAGDAHPTAPTTPVAPVTPVFPGNIAVGQIWICEEGSLARITLMGLRRPEDIVYDLCPVVASSNHFDGYDDNRRGTGWVSRGGRGAWNSNYGLALHSWSGLGTPRFLANTMEEANAMGYVWDDHNPIPSGPVAVTATPTPTTQPTMPRPEVLMAALREMLAAPPAFTPPTLTRLSMGILERDHAACSGGRRRVAESLATLPDFQGFVMDSASSFDTADLISCLDSDYIRWGYSRVDGIREEQQQLQALIAAALVQAVARSTTNPTPERQKVFAAAETLLTSGYTNANAARLRAAARRTTDGDGAWWRTVYSVAINSEETGWVRNDVIRLLGTHFGVTNGQDGRRLFHEIAKWAAGRHVFALTPQGTPVPTPRQVAATPTAPATIPNVVDFGGRRYVRRVDTDGWDVLTEQFVPQAPARYPAPQPGEVFVDVIGREYLIGNDGSVIRFGDGATFRLSSSHTIPGLTLGIDFRRRGE